MGRRVLSEQTRLQVVSAIIAGATYVEAGRLHGVSEATARNWYKESFPIENNQDETASSKTITTKFTPRQMLRRKVQSLALASLDGFERIIKTCTTKEYLESQTAGEVAVLADTIANGGVQLSNALNQLGSDDEE